MMYRKIIVVFGMVNSKCLASLNMYGKKVVEADGKYFKRNPTYKSPNN